MAESWGTVEVQCRQCGQLDYTVWAPESTPQATFFCMRCHTVNKFYRRPEVSYFVYRENDPANKKRWWQFWR
jgi:phage FluMu protein Com